MYSEVLEEVLRRGRDQGCTGYTVTAARSSRCTAAPNHRGECVHRLACDEHLLVLNGRVERDMAGEATCVWRS